MTIDCQRGDTPACILVFMTPHVAALYRYPIKGFNPEPCDSLLVQSDGRVRGDRVLTFRFANAIEPEYDGELPHWPKSGGLCTQDFPTLATLHAEYQNETVHLWHGGQLLVSAGLDSSGREQLESAATQFFVGSADESRLSRAGRLPLQLIGDGNTSQFQDRAAGYVSAHSRTSLAEFEDAVGLTLDERRFRSNIAFEGFDSWAEDDLIGSRIKVGQVFFEVTAPIIRCLAIHANPATGERDAPLLKTLTRTIGKPEPGFGILLTALEGGGQIDVGDSIEIITSP